MSVAKRGDGRWAVKFKDEEGRWRQRSFRTEEEARQFDADCQYDKVENSRLTLLEAILVYLKNTEHAEHTVGVYEFIVCGHDRKTGVHREGPAEFLANKFVDTLTRRDLETVRERCRNDGLSIATINYYVGKIKAALNWCVEQDLLHENPWGKYRQLPGAKNKPRTGTLEDFHKLFPVLPPWLQWAAQTAIALCLRPGISELFRLKWAAFDWKARTVSVYMPKVDSTKLVFMPEAYAAKAWARFQADMAAGQPLVCPGKKGHPVGERQYLSAWARACSKAGVSMPMYALRHIAASEMLANGVDIAAVAAQLGHKNITTTGTFYTHALASSQRRAAEAISTCTNLVQLGA
ncbi:tyrosine-type recombinase/integrase [uncultured Bilophila sp.]|uniref:tyrosine-type recombinase/integrase n=1 Tax=uncultured Bilophila sp. TaxID=529385 RepID=UPI00266FFEB5|nr:tyrosine-type recombinase/integrase [uncultured Bilophila sp.]